MHYWLFKGELRFRFCGISSFLLILKDTFTLGINNIVVITPLMANIVTMQ